MAMTIPNLLTFARVLCALVAAVLFAHGSDALAIAVCALGLLTDAADGWLARRLGQSSRLGAFLDPIADKTLTSVLLVVAASRLDSTLVWLLVGSILARDLLVTLYRLQVLRRWGVVRSSLPIGRIKMVVQSLVAIGLVAVLAKGGAASHVAAWSLVPVTALAWASVPIRIPKQRGYCCRPGQTPSGYRL